LNDANETILKALLILLVAPIWVPVTRVLLQEAWAVSRPQRGSEPASTASMERLVNLRWETGRKATRPAGWSARDRGRYGARRGLR
jgi:hypothetical protein